MQGMPLPQPGARRVESADLTQALCWPLEKRKFQPRTPILPRLLLALNSDMPSIPFAYFLVTAHVSHLSAVYHQQPQSQGHQCVHRPARRRALLCQETSADVATNSAPRPAPPSVSEDY